MLQAIVEPLVIAKIKAALLQFPLEIPVGLRDKQKILVRFLDRGNDRVPVFLGRSIAGSLSPGALKDLIEQKHRHIAANPVALRCNVRDRVDHGLAKTRLEGVQLHYIRPGGEVGIAAAGKKSALYLNVGLRISPGFIGADLDEVSRDAQ